MTVSAVFGIVPVTERHPGGGIHKVQKGFHDDEYFFRHDSFCQCSDFNIFKYMVRLKLALGRTGK